jgi:DNA-binding NarL/FixJ family response regulator
LGLEDVNGFDLSKILGEILPKAACAALTATEMDWHFDALLASKMIGYLQKPVGTYELAHLAQMAGLR